MRSADLAAPAATRDAARAELRIVGAAKNENRIVNAKRRENRTIAA